MKKVITKSGEVREADETFREWDLPLQGELELGQSWYVLIDQETVAREVTIVELTKATVVLEDCKDGASISEFGFEFEPFTVRFPYIVVSFLEKLSDGD